jgi:lipopolysaccharide transport system permease protein
MWLLLSPLLLVSAYLLLFGKILAIRPGETGSGLDYGLLIACGLLPWLGFSDGVTRGTSSVLAQRNLMKSRLFPMELIPVTAVCGGLLGQLSAMILLFLVLSVKGTLGANILFLPVLLFLQAMFTVGIVWFLSCINLIYRDTSQVVGFAMVLLMFLSPIAYTRQMVPPNLEAIVQLNPLSYLIEGYREILLFNHLPNLWMIGIFALLAVISLMTGYRYFMRLRRALPDFA